MTSRRDVAECTVISLKHEFWAQVFLKFWLTIWLFNIAMENSKPIYKWAIFHGYVK
jgi:hypothetical protein